ncbi:MAG TPA: NUDIX domain-containing protein [Polyangiaceae bacterium]|nr:NUDIX domain-containing protein [Polyangiaceae bacterium]
MAARVPAPAVGAVVLDRAGRVLLIRRGRPPGLGSWTLPGGRVRPGEDPEMAVERELLEETGLDVQIVAQLGIVTLEREGFSYRIHEYAAIACDDDAPLCAGDDAADARWVDRVELAALGVSDQVVALVDRAIDERQKTR